MRYKPDLQVMDFESTVSPSLTKKLHGLITVMQPDVMKMHLQEQVSTYGPQTLVNLVNHKGHEQPVKEAYERYVSLVRTIFGRLHQLVLKSLYRSTYQTSDTNTSISTTSARTCGGIGLASLLIN